MNGQNERFGSTFWISLVLIGLGITFLLDNFNFIYIGNLFEYWWLIFFAIGLGKTFGHDKNMASALLFYTLGTIFAIGYFDA